MGAEFLWWDRRPGVRVVGALAVLVLGARHEEVTPARAGDSFHADLERHGIHIDLAAISQDQRALDGAAQPAEPTAGTDETLQVLEVVVLVKQTKATTERDVGRTRALHQYGRPGMSGPPTNGRTFPAASAVLRAM